jgi:hypothetical protein
MTDSRTASAALPVIIEQQMSGEDDPALWEQVLRSLAEDASTLGAGSRLYLEIGVCSHWARPHQTRWPAAGGFAAPIGYGDGEGFVGALPNFDWSVKLQFDPASVRWITPVESPTKHYRSVRVAVPARTARHRQAALHTVWSSGTLDARSKRTVLYGFRQSDGVWAQKARSKEY